MLPKCFFITISLSVLLLFPRADLCSEAHQQEQYSQVRSAKTAKLKTEQDSSGAEEKYLDRVGKAVKYGKGDPRFGQALFDLGSCYMREKKFLQAISAYEQALQIAESTHNSYQFLLMNNLGTIYENLGDADKAAEIYKTALSLNPPAMFKRILREKLSNISQKKI